MAPLGGGTLWDGGNDPGLAETGEARRNQQSQTLRGHTTTRSGARSGHPEGWLDDSGNATGSAGCAARGQKEKRRDEAGRARAQRTAVRQLTDEGIRTNVTLCFSPTQALLAAKAGATYISSFVGRLDDISHVGMDLVRQIVTIYKIITSRRKFWQPACARPSTSWRPRWQGRMSAPSPRAGFASSSSTRSPTSGWRASWRIGRRFQEARDAGARRSRRSGLRPRSPAGCRPA